LSDKRPTTPTPPVTTADVNVDPEELGKWAKLTRTARELRSTLAEKDTVLKALEQKVADLEQRTPLADRAATVERLAKEGKLVDAMKAAGVELEQAFAQWVEESEGKSTPSAPPAELVDLKAKYDALEARFKAADDEKTKAADDEKVQAAEAGKASVLKGLNEKITAEGARWVRCAKEPETASQDALNVTVEKVKALKRAVTDEEAAELFDKALDAVESEYKALGEKFYIPEAKRPATIRPIGDYLPKRDSSPVAERKVAVTLDGQRGSLRTSTTETKGKLTAEEAKAKALASIRSMTAGR